MEFCDCNSVLTTRGNDFALRVRFYQRTIDGKQPLRLDAMRNVVVTIKDDLRRDANFQWSLDAENENAMVVQVAYDNRMSRGYVVEVTMQTEDGRHLRCAERCAFGIVEYNSEANVTFEPYGGKEGAELDMEFEVVTEAIVVDQPLVERMQGLVGEATEAINDISQWRGATIEHEDNCVYINFKNM